MIFINYRRKDAQAIVDHLETELKRKFGPANVFKDTQDIIAGQIWRDRLRQELLRAKVLLAVIGPNWLTIHDEHGRRKIDDPEDCVRWEICTALEHKKEVIVLLVDSAKPPDKFGLPKDCLLQHIPDIQHRPLRHRPDWDNDLAALIERLSSLLLPDPRKNSEMPMPSDQFYWLRDPVHSSTLSQPEPSAADPQQASTRNNESLAHKSQTTALREEGPAKQSWFTYEKKKVKNLLDQARLAEEDGDPHAALDHLKKAALVYRSLRDRDGLAKVLGKQAKIRKDIGDMKGARQALKEQEEVLSAEPPEGPVTRGREVFDSPPNAGASFTGVYQGFS